VAVFALALGIGASTVVFSVFYSLVFNAFAARDAARLVVRVIEDAERPGEEDSLTLLPADLDAVREQNRVFDNIVGYVAAGGIVLANDGPETYQFFDTRVTALTTLSLLWSSTRLGDSVQIPALAARLNVAEPSKTRAWEHRGQRDGYRNRS
jgi:hypothetical protein